MQSVSWPTVFRLHICIYARRLSSGLHSSSSKVRFAGFQECNTTRSTKTAYIHPTSRSRRLSVEADIAAVKDLSQKPTPKPRSARDNKSWELCLTPTALEATGNNNKALLLRLDDVVGARATPTTSGGAWNKQEGFIHRLEVFAYVPGGNSTEKQTGCTASGG